MLSLQNRERERDKNQPSIQQLRTEIQQLEAITNRTLQQEQELQSKKAELARLETQNTQLPNKTNWTPWIIGSILIIGVIGLIIYFNSKKKDEQS